MFLPSLCLVLTLIGSYQTEPWRKIKPLHSTRADVEQLLGPPTAACKCFYEGNDVNVQVLYSSGDCKSEDSAWNIPTDTVIRFTVYFAKRPWVSGLKIDLTKYSKIEDPEVVGYIYYVNKEDGMTISVYQDQVTEYVFGPTTKDGKLRCPDTPRLPAQALTPLSHRMKLRRR